MGWHVPTELEWAYLLDKVEGDGTGSLFVNAADEIYLGADVG